MALQELGQPAISLTGAQVGIVTEAEHFRARILHIRERISRHLKDGKVIVVAGFQGYHQRLNWKSQHWGVAVLIPQLLHWQPL